MEVKGTNLVWLPAWTTETIGETNTIYRPDCIFIVNAMVTQPN